MKRPRFSEEQIIATLQSQENVVSTADVCREHGISSGTYQRCNSKFGGLEVSDARKLRELETENAKLKNLLAEQILANAMLTDIASRKR